MAVTPSQAAILFWAAAIAPSLSGWLAGDAARPLEPGLGEELAAPLLRKPSSSHASLYARKLLTAKYLFTGGHHASDALAR